MLPKNAFSKSRSLFKTLTMQVQLYRSKTTVDKSKVPVINENDLEEHFIKGSGPGGQKVNKTNNCVFLLHKPSGFSVKVHESRNLSQNRQLAREKIITMLDNFINKENSVENQKKRILKEKSVKMAQKQKKLREMKENWRKTVSEYSDNKID